MGLEQRGIHAGAVLVFLNPVNLWVPHKVKKFEFLERKFYWIYEPNIVEMGLGSFQVKKMNYKMMSFG